MWFISEKIDSRVRYYIQGTPAVGKQITREGLMLGLLDYQPEKWEQR